MRRPHRLATWLLSATIADEHRDSLIGDLLEQYQRGHSSAWFWRQTASALAAEIRRHKMLVIGVGVLGWYLGQIYGVLVAPTWIGHVDRWWYRPLLESRWGWLLVDPWAHRLQPYALTTRITYCAFVAIVVALTVRVFPRQRALLASMFVITQIAAGLPYFGRAFTYWVQEPASPLWFFNVLWFSIFAFIAVPAAVATGARSWRAARI